MQVIDALALLPCAGHACHPQFKQLHSHSQGLSNLSTNNFRAPAQHCLITCSLAWLLCAGQAYHPHLKTSYTLCKDSQIYFTNNVRTSVSVCMCACVYAFAKACSALGMLMQAAWYIKRISQ
eukprot:562746-Pelagomonas_calceolata.AAC.1